MAGTLAAASGAGAPTSSSPAQAGSGRQPALAGKSSGDSFLEALGLKLAPAGAPDAKAPPPAKQAAAPETPDHPIGEAPAPAPAAAPDNAALAWLVRLIGGGTEPAPAQVTAIDANGSAGASPAGEKTLTKGAAAAVPAAAPQSAPAVAAPPAAVDPAVLAAGGTALVAALPPASAAAGHDRNAAVAAVVAAVGPPLEAPAPPPPLVVSGLQNNFASLLAQTPAAAPLTPAQVALPQDPAVWPAALNEHVRWQLGQGVQEARLDLHPRELGSVQVHLRLTAGGAEVQFAAVHPQARQALEASLPQLRALLAADGLHLAQAQVGSQSQPQSQWQAQAGRPRFSRSDETPADDADGAEPIPDGRLHIVRVGLVDDFA